MSELHSANLDVLLAEVAYRHGADDLSRPRLTPPARRFWITRKSRTG